jgi:hypothetical protein
MTITINGTTGIAGVDGSASTPAVQGADTNTGIFFPAADTIAFAEGGAEVARFDSNGSLLIATTNAITGVTGSQLTVSNPSENPAYINIFRDDTTIGNGQFLGYLQFCGRDATSSLGTAHAYVAAVAEADHGAGDNATAITFGTTPDNSSTISERVRIDSNGYLLVGTTNTSPTSNNVNGFALLDAGQNIRMTATSSNILDVNRKADDGNLVLFRQDGTIEGTISVSGTTVSYNGGHLSRWAQMLTKPNLLKGTVMSNLDEMNIYIAPTTYWTEEDELPEGVNVGDVKVETHEVQNEQLNKVKVSDVEGDVNVAGVFVNWTYDEAHQVDEINMAMTGDMIIRIAQGVVVQKGDLLMSAGDGTAKPQGDDIVRSKTVAKVTSNHVTCTYEDGSYCVPCVLMAC